MLSEPWRSTVVVEASRVYFAAAVLVSVRSFLSVPDLSYWRGLLENDLRSSPGLVGHSVHVDPTGRRYCLVTLWCDTHSREAFTASALSRGLLEEAGPQVAEGACAAWDITGAEAPPSLAAALGHLGHEADVLRGVGR